MKTLRPALHVVFVLTSLMVLNAAAQAQAISSAFATPPDIADARWTIKASFSPAPAREKIKRVFIVRLEDAKMITLQSFNPSSVASNIYVGKSSEPLKTVNNPTTGKLELVKHQLNVFVENAAGDEMLSLSAKIELLDPDHELDQPKKVKASDADGSDVYLSGELNKAKDKDTTFTTTIKLQRYKPIKPSWRFTPFFKLNASTDPNADPDTMEIGMKTRYVIGKFAGIPGALFDNEVKLESERDFDNTNFIYDTRLTFLPAAFPKGAESKGKVFFSPYIGAEVGKNMKSPLQAAEGDGIARLLVGADLRFAFFLKTEDEPDIDWITSYTRRWLLTDELGFETDKNNVLQLLRFGTSPRDYVLSKFSYKLTKFLDVFAAYEWGQLPPSYKFVDHRFQFGFAYKYKFAIK
jgi:hypothetical protein